jgi:hypothetical protein
VFVGEKVLWGEVLFLNNARGNERRVRRKGGIFASI